MIVLLMEDLVDTCKAGDDVIIHGVVLRRWQNLYEGERADCELIMVANHISVNNENKFGQGVTEELRVKFERYWEQNKSQPLKGTRWRRYLHDYICLTGSIQLEMKSLKPFALKHSDWQSSNLL